MPTPLPRPLNGLRLPVLLLLLMMMLQVIPDASGAKNEGGATASEMSGAGRAREDVLATKQLGKEAAAQVPLKASASFRLLHQASAVVCGTHYMFADTAKSIASALSNIFYICAKKYATNFK